MADSGLPLKRNCLSDFREGFHIDEMLHKSIPARAGKHR
jgi:hypothetical protein